MTVASIVAAAAARFQMPRRVILGADRSRPAARARYAVFYVARTGLGKSSTEIGRAVGGRDHTTVLHGLKRAEQMRASDAEFRAATDELLGAVS